MKNLYIVANWKANINEEEATEWFDFFKNNADSTRGELANKKIIVCPTFPILPFASAYVSLNNLQVSLGAQDISQFPIGAYTGEVPAAIVKKYAEFVIIGHSERRMRLNETDATLFAKVAMANGALFEIIYCVQDENTTIPEGIKIVAYEPVGAIGTGNPDTPENAQKIAAAIKEKNPFVRAVLYGGSVNAENVSQFTEQASIDGVLIGGASLVAGSFTDLLFKC